MAKSHKPATKVRSGLPAVLNQLLVGLNLLALPGLVLVIALAGDNALPTIADSPYAALAVSVLLLALTLDIFTALVLLGRRFPIKGSTERIVVMAVVGLGLIMLTAKLMYVGL